MACEGSEVGLALNACELVLLPRCVQGWGVLLFSQEGFWAF